MTEDSVYTVHSAEREVTPAFTLNQIGKFAYKQAVEGGIYPAMNLTTAQLMCALTMEAVLNHVGVKLFVEDASEPAVWAGVERLSPKMKLLAIAERTGLAVDLGSAPYQDFTLIFRFRDQLAHAKTMRLVTTEIPEAALDSEQWLDHSKVPGLLADWEKACSPDTAKRWRDSVYSMSEALCEAAGCVDPVRIGDSSSWGGSWTPPAGDL